MPRKKVHSLKKKKKIYWWPVLEEKKFYKFTSSFIEKETKKDVVGGWKSNWRNRETIGEKNSKAPILLWKGH